MRFLLLALVLAIGPGAATYAAEITTDHLGNIRIAGAIGHGDAGKLKTVIQKCNDVRQPLRPLEKTAADWMDKKSKCASDFLDKESKKRL